MRVSEGYSGATRGGVVSKSATKAPRAGIGRGGNRGISTILLARPDSIGAFVADLDTDRVRTGSDWSHATRAPHLSQVPLLAAPPGAEHGAPGGSFRGAPDCEAVRTAQSCGNRRTHPGRGPERSSQGTRIGSGPWAPLRHTQNNLPGARSGGVCPNLPQRPGSSRNTGRESLVFRAFLRRQFRPVAPLWQIWTRPHSGPIPEIPRVSRAPSRSAPAGLHGREDGSRANRPSQ